MKHGLLYTLGPIVLVTVAFTTSPAQVRQLQQAQPAQTAVPYKQPLKTLKAVTLDEARRAVASAMYPAMYDSGWTVLIGVANARYNLQTGEIWLTSINDGTPPYTQATAGFRTCAIQNTGTYIWKGVTVQSTLQLISASGIETPSIASVHLNSISYINGNQVSYVSHNYLNLGGQYIITSGGVDLPPGSTFQGNTWITITPSIKNNGASAYAKMLSMKINL